MAEQRTSAVTAQLERELAALESRAQRRRLTVSDTDGFFSNDYLGLSTDPRLKEAVIRALARRAAAGSTGSRLLSGNSAAWEELESELAQFTGAQAALYFNSGYAANAGLLGCIARTGDVIFSDAANHASLIDGMRLSGAQKKIFPHLDLDFLERELRRDRTSAAGGRKFIVAESVFSMDGDRAPLADLMAIGERHGAELIVDEAHAIGVFGPQGRGLVAQAGLTDRVFAAVYPCGKAFAGMGAFVCGSETLKQYLVNHARTFIFSTALPPYIAAQMSVAVGIVCAADAERAALAAGAAFLRGRLAKDGFDTLRSDSQIVPVLLGTNERAVHFAERLSDAGIAVRAIRPPTVPEGTARLRLSLNAGHSIELLGRLADELERIRDEEAGLTSARMLAAAQPRTSTAKP